MSTFKVPVVRIKALEPIPGADAIELAVVGDYRSVVKKGDFTVGDLGVYIPEAAIVPQWLLRVINLEGKLSGGEKNRVKAIKLRGCLSQGILIKPAMSGVFEPAILPTDSQANADLKKAFQVLVYKASLSRPKDPSHPNGGMPEVLSPISMSDEMLFNEGDDTAEWLGITKWEPPIPASMAGDVYNAGQNLTVPYDIENYKWFPDVFDTDEHVIFTEKLHGTFCGVGILPAQDQGDQHYQGEFVVFSKGLGGRGLCFKDTPANMGNVYFRALHGADIFNKLRYMRDLMIGENHEFPKPVFILGEAFGGNIQDAGWYSDTVAFRMFDVAAGYRGDQHFFGYEARKAMSMVLDIEMVPVLYEGPFSKEVMEQYTNGKETVSGQERNIREGIVVTPVDERRDPELGRVILKSVSADYLLRKGGSEFN